MTDMDKVKELVEQIAENLYTQRWCKGQVSWKASLLKELFRNYAKQILSHPDLALIVGQEDVICNNCGELAGDETLVIPLAPAIKEMK